MHVSDNHHKSSFVTSRYGDDGAAAMASSFPTKPRWATGAASASSRYDENDDDDDDDDIFYDGEHAPTAKQMDSDRMAGFGRRAKLTSDRTGGKLGSTYNAPGQTSASADVTKASIAAQQANYTKVQAQHQAQSPSTLAQTLQGANTFVTPKQRGTDAAARGSADSAYCSGGSTYGSGGGGWQGGGWQGGGWQGGSSSSGGGGSGGGGQWGAPPWAHQQPHWYAQPPSALAAPRPTTPAAPPAAATSAPAAPAAVSREDKSAATLVCNQMFTVLAALQNVHVQRESDESSRSKLAVDCKAFLQWLKKRVTTLVMQGDGTLIEAAVDVYTHSTSSVTNITMLIAHAQIDCADALNDPLEGAYDASCDYD
jgi:hypothetical protein